MSALKAGKQRLRAVVTGRVQGVFFRAWTQDQARRLGLRGWVHNLPDRGVEILAEGPREALEELARLCWEGPSAAVVEGVQCRWEASQGDLEPFHIRYF